MRAKMISAVFCTTSLEVMNNLNSNNRKNIKAFWKFANESIKSSAKNKIETFTDDSGNSFYSHTGEVKILKSHYKTWNLTKCEIL